MSHRIYLDNAATSFPKAPKVAAQMSDYLIMNGCNINRGGYHDSYSVEEKVFDCRFMLASLFGLNNSANVIFTRGVTESLNIAIRGLVGPQDHVITSSLEHNAVVRTLFDVLEDSCEGISTIPISECGDSLLDGLEQLIRSNSRAIIVTAASNVCGTLVPLEKLGNFAEEHGLLFIVDAAQSAGIVPIDMERMHIDVLCVSGHKGLMGPQGIGAMLLSDRVKDQVPPLITGGTGSFSDLEYMPKTLPDRLEAGTLNIPGIIGLMQGVDFIRETGIENIFEHEMKLTRHLLDGLIPLEEEGLLRIVGHRDTENRIGVVSLAINCMDASEAAFLLDENYGVETRVGLHCSPWAHRSLETFPEGTLRLSVGFFNSLDDVSIATDALNMILHSNRK